MRNNAFIEAVAERARSGGHAIEMMGSGLAHACYIMARSGAPIVVPSQRGHKRIRKLRTFGKLVRDGIPKKIRDGGEEVIAEPVRPEERRRVLLAKLLEETQEVAEATNVDDVRSELADLLEVVRGLVRNEGLGWAEVERAADEKADRLGAFDDGTVLLATAAAGPGFERRRRSAEADAVRVTRDGNTITIPHLVLIEDGVELSVAGQDVRVTFTTDGLAIEELGPKSDDGQLRLPLSD
jgi:predicted house-cleaning noncanonical NTP pyrophosphatase (MazG superfamily)